MFSEQRYDGVMILNIEYKNDYNTFKKIVKKYFKPKNRRFTRPKTDHYTSFTTFTAHGANGWRVEAECSIFFTRFKKLISPEGEEIIIEEGSNTYAYPDDWSFAWFWLDPVNNLATSFRSCQRNFLSEEHKKTVENRYDETAVERQKTVEYLERY